MSEKTTIEVEGQGQKTLDMLLSTASKQSHGQGAMELGTVDEPVHDASTQGIAAVNDGSLPGEISIHDSNKNDDDCSLPTLSDIELSLTTKPYKELEDDLYSNQNYLNTSSRCNQIIVIVHLCLANHNNMFFHNIV